MDSRQQVIEAAHVNTFTFHGASVGAKYSWALDTFSVGIFKVVMRKDGKGEKAAPVIFRVKGVVGHELWVSACAQYICDALNNDPPANMLGGHVKKFCREKRDEFIREHKPTWM